MTRQRRITCFFLAVIGIAFVLLSPARSRAQATFSLTPSPATIVGSGTIDFQAILTNTGSEAITLFGGFGSTPLNDMLWQDTDFNAGLPEVLNPSSSYTGTVSLLIASGTPVGNYDVEYGVFGLGNSTGNFYIPVANVTVEVQASSVNVMPEPHSVLLLLTVLSLCGFMRVLRSIRKGANGE